MKNQIDLLTVSTAICVASYLAIALDYVAHARLGFSSGQIRSVSLFSATLIAALIAIDFFGKKLRKVK